MKKMIIAATLLIALTNTPSTNTKSAWERIAHKAQQSCLDAGGIAVVYGLSIGCVGGAVATVYGLIASGYHAYHYARTSNDLERKKMVRDGKIALCGAVSCAISTMIVYATFKEVQHSILAHIEAGGSK